MTGVLVIGAGGIGCPALLHLASRGCPLIGIADFDRVEVSNLPRQILYRPEDIGAPKVIAARDRLMELPGARSLSIRVHETVVRGDEDYLQEYGVVLEAADGAAMKIALHDAIVKRRIPLVHAGALAWSAQGLAVDGPGCLRCLFGFDADDEAPDCRRAGIVGPVAGLAGLRAAEEALNLALKRPCRWLGRLWRYDGLNGRSGYVEVPARADCPVCVR